jgi:hypothetical protein
MTPEEKIAALIEHIKKEFPSGCIGVTCKNCVLYNAKPRTTESAVCEVLYRLMKYSTG